MTAAVDTREAARLVKGKIGVTLLCAYLFVVALRIGGCYQPDGRARDDLPSKGPGIGDAFPAFDLLEVSGGRLASSDLAGTPALLVFVPSLDWSPPTKARLIDLAQAFTGRKDVRVAVVMTEAQKTPRSLAFIRERDTPFYYLIDGAGLVERLGLATKAPDGSVASLPATFLLDAAGIVRLRDVRRQERTWVAAEVLLAALDKARVSRDAVCKRDVHARRSCV